MGSLHSHTDGIVVGEFYTEGGDAFLSKLILNTAVAKEVYKNDNIFETAINQVVKANKGFNDILLDDNGDNYKGRPSTINLIKTNSQHLTQIQIKYLQLSAAGFERIEIAKLLNTSIDNLKKIISKLLKLFKCETHTDLISVAISAGIVKYVHIYQPQKVVTF